MGVGRGEEMRSHLPDLTSDRLKGTFPGLSFVKSATSSIPETIFRNWDNSIAFTLISSINSPTRTVTRSC